MSDMDSLMDMFISPILKNNNPLNQITNTNSKTQAENIDAFEKVFDDISEQFENEIENITKPVKKSENKVDEKDSSENYLDLMGRHFGPPAGLEIEGFEYSLI